jgi:hypothetical protein
VRHLIIGMGQIGSAWHQVLSENKEVVITWDVQDKQTLADMLDNQLDRKIDVLHIAIPYSDNFVDVATEYMTIVKADHVLVHSTVPIGTCRTIDLKVVHSPVEGRHPKLADSLRLGRHWIGFNDGVEGRFFSELYARLKLFTQIVHRTERTEFLKLRSTAKYGINLLWTHIEEQIAHQFDIPFDDVMAYDQNYNQLYQQLGEDFVKRYILYPTGGKIGGHCIVPNAKLLKKQFDSPILDMIIAMGEGEDDGSDTTTEQEA